MTPPSSYQPRRVAAIPKTPPSSTEQSNYGHLCCLTVGALAAASEPRHRRKQIGSTAWLLGGRLSTEPWPRSAVSYKRWLGSTDQCNKSKQQEQARDEIVGTAHAATDPTVIQQRRHIAPTVCAHDATIVVPAAPCRGDSKDAAQLHRAVELWAFVLPNGWRFSCGERAPPQTNSQWFRSLAAGSLVKQRAL